MKRSEMIDHIEAELLDFIESFILASEKRKPHVIQQAANKILDMELGFGMLPPEQPIPKYQMMAPNEWESEDE